MMTPEEMKELIKTTIQETKFLNTLIVAVVPVILTMITTVITNVVYDAFKRKSESKKQYAMEQLKELYLLLYSIISQSEFMKYFYEIPGNLEEIPFAELHQSLIEVKGSLKEGKGTKTVSIVENEITKFSKSELDRLIIEKCQYASGNLIKLAVAHRYLESNYLTVDKKEMADKFADKEVVVLAKLVRLVIRETNEKLKYCNMKYDEFELINGLMNVKVY